MKTNNIPGVFLVTRPEEKSSDFIETLSLRGVKTRSLPMISVEPSNFSTDCEGIEQKILKLFKFDLVIFVSTYAVNILDDLLNKYNFVWSPKLHCIAIGSQTAKAIKEKGWPIDENCFFDDSKHQQTSESLLSLPPLQNVLNKNIIIIRGHGGREFLSSILKNRGAKVEYFELYSRTAKSYELNYLVEALGIGSEGTPIGSGVSFVDFRSTNGTGVSCQPAVNGIATVTFTPGVSLGLAIALGG